MPLTGAGPIPSTPTDPRVPNAPINTSYGWGSGNNSRDMWAYLNSAYQQQQQQPPVPPGSLEPAPTFQGLADAIQQWQQAQLAAQMPWFTTRMNLTNAQYGANVGFANRDYDLGLRDIALREQGIGIDRQGIGIDRQGIDINRQRAHLSRLANQYLREYLGQQRGFANRELDQNLLDAMAQGVRRTVTNNSENVAGGGWFTPGRRWTNENILFDTRLAGDRARLAHERELARIGYQERGTDITDREIDLRLRDLDLDEQRLNLANQRLDLAAAQLGVDRDRLKLELDRTLSRLGFSREGALTDILAAIGSHNDQISQMGFQLYEMLINLAMSQMG